MLKFGLHIEPLLVETKSKMIAAMAQSFKRSMSMPKKKKQERRKSEDPEAELRKNLREHTKLESERTSTEDYREYGKQEDGKE